MAKFGKNEKGFTLIELLVVIAIIGLLASIVLVSLNSARQKARDSRRISDLRQISSALELYYDDYGYYPMVSGSGSWLDVYVRLQTELQNEDLMNPVPQDPNGTSRSYWYYHCSSGQNYRLRAILEDTGHSALDNDLDGNFYGSSGRCEDSNGYYCIGTPNWCW